MLDARIVSFNNAKALASTVPTTERRFRPQGGRGEGERGREGEEREEVKKTHTPELHLSRARALFFYLALRRIVFNLKRSVCFKLQALFACEKGFLQSQWSATITCAMSFSHYSFTLVFHCVLGLSRLIWNTCQYLAMCWLLHGSLWAWSASTVTWASTLCTCSEGVGVRDCWLAFVWLARGSRHVL